MWDWVKNVKAGVDKSQFRIFLIGCWNLWFNRNKVGHHGKGFDVMESVEFVLRFAGFQRSNIYQPTGGTQRARVPAVMFGMVPTT